MLSWIFSGWPTSTDLLTWRLLFPTSFAKLSAYPMSVPYLMRLACISWTTSPGFVQVSWTTTHWTSSRMSPSTSCLRLVHFQQKAIVFKHLYGTHTKILWLLSQNNNQNNVTVVFKQVNNPKMLFVFNLGYQTITRAISNNLLFTCFRIILVQSDMIDSQVFSLFMYTVVLR